MKKTLTLLLILVLTCLTASALAGTEEKPEALSINEKISLVDYGFAAAGADGYVKDFYGYILESDEEADAASKKPCVYIGLHNNSSSAESVKVYLRGGAKYNCYWRDSFMIPAGETVWRLYTGHKKISTYCGQWSVDLTGKNGLVRFTMGRE